MNAIRDPYTGMTIKQADRRWNVIEHDLEILQKRKEKFYEWVNHFRLTYGDIDWTDVDYWNDQMRRLNEEQGRLEMFLIENEAPGWVST